ncbi:MAG: rhomboid family intramembrane serine protease [Candidatus Poribacteria bacterium]
MLPIRDNVQSKTPPIVTIVLIVINVAVFFFEVSLGSRLNEFLFAFGFVPSKFFHLLERGDFVAILPLFAYMFLHGGWLHIIGNMWFLWIFGDNVEDRMGHVKFLFFYILCGLIAVLVHAFLNSQSGVPTVGASGATAGVMGAYFILYPRAKIWTLIPILFFVQFVEIPAFVFLGFWILIQFFVGAFSMSMGSLSGGVAWWAHVGGFVAGILLVFIFRKKRIMPRRFADEYKPW